MGEQLFPQRVLSDNTVCQAALAIILLEERQSFSSASISQDPFSPFTFGTGVRVNDNLIRKIALCDGDKTLDLNVEYNSKTGCCHVHYGDKVFVVDGFIEEKDNKTVLTCEVDKKQSKANIVMNGQTLHIFSNDGEHALELPSPKFVTESMGGASKGEAVSPMPGVIDRVLVKPGDMVEKGEVLVVMIAMKMEYKITASKSGTVKSVLYNPGDNVKGGKLLVEFEAAE